MGQAWDARSGNAAKSARVVGIVGGWSAERRERFGVLGGEGRCWGRGVHGENRAIHNEGAAPAALGNEKVGDMSSAGTPDDDVLAREQRPFSEKLDREEGVLSEPDAHEVGTGHGGPPSAPDDYSSDPFEDTNAPGTIDDIPLTYGEELPAPADEHLVPEGTTRESAREKPAQDDTEDVGRLDARQLWDEQSALVDEDEAEGLKLTGFPDEEIPEILEAMGDDAADPLQDFPNGTSATGTWTQPEHGGFPERKD